MCRCRGLTSPTAGSFSCLLNSCSHVDAACSVVFGLNAKVVYWPTVKPCTLARGVYLADSDVFVCKMYVTLFMLVKRTTLMPTVRLVIGIGSCPQHERTKWLVGPYGL